MGQAQQVIARALEAAQAFMLLDQRAVDKITRAAYLAAMDQRVALAKLAHEETGIGVWQHKVIKNVIAAQLVYEDIKHQRTVDVVHEDEASGLVEVARPIGPLLGFVPVTNPTSTAVFKSLIALKTRNPLILSPPQAARRCVAAAAKACLEAARAAGAPEHCIQWLDRPSPATVEELMESRGLAMIIATGTHPLVRKAFRSGTPTVGVGPGNVPAYIGATADIPHAVRCIIESKTLDNGTVCASEQAVVVRRAIAEQAVEELRRQGTCFLTPDEAERVGAIAFDRERGTMAASVVGQPAQQIAARAGVEVPPETSVLVAELKAVGPEVPLSAEILAPILALYIEEDFDTAIQRCSEITRYGGVGHTAVIHSNNDERIEYFTRVVEASRILVNMPATQGALGGIYNTLSPSFTLSCGAGANNTTTDNITTRHLLNIHRITRRRPNPRWVSFEQAKYFDEALSGIEIEREFNKNF